MKMIRVHIVDDEPLARQILRQMLEAHGDVEVVGESASGTAAVRDIRALQPDLVFLDVQMPGKDGFEVLRGLGTDLPHVIFATAFDHYAIRAFRVHALDYLLKPFDEGTVCEALDRFRNSSAVARRSAETQQIIALLEELTAKSDFAQRLVVRAEHRQILLDVSAIDSIEADGKVVHVRAGDRKYVIRDKLYNVQSMLDPEQFLRISRSAIVNLDRISAVEPWTRGELMVTMANGARLATTRAYRAAITGILH